MDGEKCLMVSDFCLKKDLKLIKTFPESHVMTNILRYVSSNVISVKECQERYPKVIHDTHLCISAKDGKSSCNVNTLNLY